MNREIPTVVEALTPVSELSVGIAAFCKSSATTNTPATVLFVDDEPNILTALRQLFRSTGYRVLTAESGSAALELLEHDSVDVVISDMCMPTMNGAELLEHIRKRWPDMVRLLLTGQSDVTSTIAAVNRGYRLKAGVSQSYSVAGVAGDLHL